VRGVTGRLFAGFHEPALRPAAALRAAQEHGSRLTANGVLVTVHVTGDPTPHDQRPLKLGLQNRLARWQGECQSGTAIDHGNCAENTRLDERESDGGHVRVPESCAAHRFVMTRRAR
jgi:hypothetical protein